MEIDELEKNEGASVMTDDKSMFMDLDENDLFHDRQVVKKEIYDMDAMNHLLNYSGLSTEMKQKLQKYKKNRRNINEVQVVYEWGKELKDLKFGRIYGNGLQGFDKEIRATLADKYYFDLDMVNSQPVILVHLCKKYGWTSPNLEEYVNSRDEKISQLMKEMNVPRQDVKEFFIQLLFGSKIAYYLKHPFMIAITEEMTNIMNNVAAKYPDILQRVEKIYKKDASKKNKDYKAGCIAHVVQNEEINLLLKIDKILSKHNRQMDVLIHDGGLVRKLPNELEFPSDLIKIIEEEVFKLTDYKIKLAIKPMSDKKIVFTGKAKKYLPNDVIVSDSFAAKKFVDILNDKIVLDIHYGRYIFDIKTGLWSQNEQVLRNYLNIYASDMIFYQVGSLNDKIFDYSGKESNIKNMIANINRHLIPIDFINRKGFSSIGKFLFENGIYDMETQLFTEGFDPKYLFFSKIHRKYLDKDIDLCKKVHKILFEDPYIFPEQELQATWFKRGIARALYGNVFNHKNCYITVGQPNCGRGLLTTALQHAFGDYVIQFHPNNLIYNANNSSDEAKKLAWVIPLANSRLCIGNEITMDQKKFIDGGQLKSLSGGGDSTRARLNHQDDTLIDIRTIFLLQVNDIPAIKPADEAVSNRVVINELKKTYKENPNSSNPIEMKQDPSLKSLFMTEEYKNAVFHLMSDIYNEWIQDGSKTSTPDSLRSLTSEWIETSNSIASILENNYEITNNEDDVVPARDIIELLKRNGCMESDAKIGRELSKLGCNPKRKKIGNKCITVRTNIKYIETNRMYF